MEMTQQNILAKRPGKMICRDGETVLKIFDENYSKANILNEALNQARVEETGLPVPKILEILTIDGKWAIRQQFIPGETLEKKMEDDPAHLDQYLDRFLQIQIDVFSHKAPGLNKLKDKMMTRIAQSKFDATTRYELQTRLNGLPKHEKICHGDFNPSNIIITPDDEPYILDWSHATQGNASADAALTYMLFYLEGKEELAEKYLRLFCTMTDTAKQYVQGWMPIVAAAQSVKGKPEEADFLKRWVNVVQYE